MTTTRSAALAFLLCLAAGPALAATCHMTVQGVPVVDDQQCAATGRSGDVRVVVGAENTIWIRRSIMKGRFVARRPSDGRLRRVVVNYGHVVTSATDSDDKACYFNQRATLCVDP